MNYRNKEREEAASLLQEYPLTQGQAALWFHYKLAPKSVAYNLAGAVAVQADTDLQALRRAFQKVAGRHPMLRTLFAAEHGKPVQRVYSSLKVAFQVDDATKWDPAKLDDRLAEEIYRPFDLEQGPTWRVLVFREAPIPGKNERNIHLHEHLVLLVLHHLIVDLWSIAILMSEVAALYRQETTGSPASLKPLRANFAGHVQKEMQWLSGPQADMSWNYWQTALSGELPLLNLPTDRHRKPESTRRGAAHSMLLDKKLTGELHALAKQQQVPLYTVLLAGFQTLLHRYTDQNDILVGFPKAGRSSSTVRVVGYFINQMVVRADFSENPSFIELLKSVQKTIEASSQHDSYPFSLLVQRLQPDRELNRSPLIQAVFSWQQAPRLIPRENSGPLMLGEADQAVDLDGLFVRSVHLPYRAAPFDLIMLAAEAPEGLAMTIDYATDLFDPPTIARMAASYQALLESITSAPEQPVSSLTILPGTERETLLDTWNSTEAPYPSQLCLHQLFEQQAERTPEVKAVACENDQMTYRQLNLQANQLAHFLQEQGVGSNRLVGVYLEPSVQMIEAILGILKAGGAYLPLDPNNPKERLAFMLADARPDMLITCQALRTRLPDFAGASFIIDADEDRPDTQPQTNPSCAVTPDHPAYVMYTSGSTGQPKGAILAHRGVVNLLAEFQRRQAIQPGEGCSWWTSPSFDVSVYEIFSPLLAGGRLQVIPENIRLDAPSLFDWLQEHDIRSAYLPPFLLEDFAARVQTQTGASQLRRLLVGVEPIPDALLTGLIAQMPALCILNGYGPTETTICSTLYEVDTAHPQPGNTPIGRPAANTQIYLLDPRLQPVPIGVVGELYIGGVGLAHGYLNRPDLTAQRFIQSPFRTGELLYRTGDLARYLPDGNLFFVGRSDTQVKLHGVRIELGEIEATLTQHPGVKQAVVRLHEQTSGGKQLVAYVTSSHDPPPPPEELRAYLSLRLPASMNPSDFVVLDAFPLTTTGKVNRKALPVPEKQQVKQRIVSQAPWTDVEKTLASILQQVLGVERVGRDDNFFELGGDSILSLQFVALASEAGLRLRPQHIFQAPTIAGLAALAKSAEPAQNLPAPASAGAAIPLTPIQHWFFQQGFSDSHHWNQSLMFIPSRPLDPVHLRSAVSALLRQHDALRLRFENGTSGWQQTLSDTVEQIPFEVIDLSTLSSSQQEEAINKQVAARQSSLNLTAGPLVRVIYFVFGANLPGRLLIVIHHLVVDGVSWRILLEDLQGAYLQNERGQPIRLPPKTTAFHTWAWRLAAYAQSADLAQEASFWQRMIENCQQTRVDDLLFPDQTSYQQNTEDSAHPVSVSLEYEETQSLLHQAPEAYRTETVDLLLTALLRAFQHLTSTDAFWIDLEAHGREDIFDAIDLFRTIGWFTTLYPVCLELPLNAGLDRSIKSIKEQLRRIPHHGLGYGLLRYLCQDPKLSERFKEVAPAPVSFNYLGQISDAGAGGFLSGPAPHSIGYQRNPGAKRPHLIEINAAIYRGELSIEWNYSAHIHSRRTIEQAAGFFMDELRNLIAHCRSLQVAGYTPSDFPGADLSQIELDAILRMPSGPKAATVRRNLQAIYPLSPMQQGMIFHTLYTPESGIYFEQTTFTIQGQFDVSAFEKAWQRALDRHTILRASFVWHDLNRMLQVVHRDVKVPFRLQNWREVPVTEQQVRFENLLAEERRRGFDLSVPPLLRLDIVQINSDTYAILLNHHHALLDGWSVSMLFEEVFAYYDAAIRNQELALSPAKPYQDYITWLHTQDLVAAEAFWRKELDGFIPFTSNPRAASPSPPTGASQPAEQDERLSVPNTTALNALARKQRLTISTFIQGAWAILLSRIFHRDDVLFGVTVSGRSPDLPGCLNMIGLFINTLPLRVRIDPQARLLEWLQHIQSKAIDIQQFDYSPLAHIQTWSGLPRSSPLFDTLLVFENYPTPTFNHKLFGSLRIANIRSIEQATYPLTIAITPDQELRLRILYNPARFDPDHIRLLLNHLRDVLERMISDPNQSLADLYDSTQLELDRFVESQTGKEEAASSQTYLLPADQQPGERVPKEEIAGRGGQSIQLVSPLEEYLSQQWKKVLNIERLNDNDNFFQLGGDSLKGAVCAYQLQNAMHETIPLNAIFEAPTISAYARYLEQNHPAGVARLLGISLQAPMPVKEDKNNPTIVPIQPKGSQPPLFCIHPAGGVVFPYYALSAYINEDRPLYGIQDPSVYDTQSVPESIEAMAAGYIEAIKTVQPEDPYHLLGWSAGSVVAYEMAQQLSRQGHYVANLLLLDSAAPDPVKTGPSPSLRKGWQQRSLAWIKALPNGIHEVPSAIQPIASYIRSGLFLLAASSKQGDTSPDGRLALGSLLGWAVLDTWRTFLLREDTEITSTISQETSLLLIKMPAVRRILELVREHRRLVRRYTAESYQGNITLFRAIASGPDQKDSADPTLGWGTLAQNGVEVRTIRANHAALFVKPHVKVLAHELMACLNNS